MRRIALHFPLRWKAGLGALLAWSWLSGVGFFALHRWFQIEGDFGPEKHPMEPWLLKAHGAGAFVSLIAFGYLLASHIPTGWRTKRARRLGLTMVASIVLMALTGYGLYYIADEDWRAAVGWLHLGIGVLLPLTLMLHIFFARRAKRSPEMTRGAAS